jgi:hypothetical protein
MVECPRCGQAVAELHTVMPDAISKELLNSLDHGDEEIAAEAGLKICAECVDEVKHK